MKPCKLCGTIKDDSEFEFINRLKNTRRDICRLCEADPGNWVQLEPDERAVRLRLVQALPGDKFIIAVPSPDNPDAPPARWRVARTPYRFDCWTPCSGKLKDDQQKTRGVGSNYEIRRAVAIIIAAIFGETAAPELKFRNVVKVGQRYAAYSLTNLELVAYADTPEEAYELAVTWNQTEKLISHRPQKGEVVQLRL